MPMPEVFERFINPSFRYDFARGPAQVRSIEDAMQGGLNCVALAHLVMRDLYGVELPPELHCAEMYLDTERFARVPATGSLGQGDLVWFGVSGAATRPEDFQPQYENGALVNWRSFPVKHVTVFTGEHDEAGDPLLLHTTHLTGTNVIWPLRRFGEHRRYQHQFGASRLAINGAAAEAA